MKTKYISFVELINTTKKMCGHDGKTSRRPGSFSIASNPTIYCSAISICICNEFHPVLTVSSRQNEPVPIKYAVSFRCHTRVFLPENCRGRLIHAWTYSMHCIQ